MQNFLDKIYNFFLRHSLILGVVLIALYTLMLFFNAFGWEPEPGLGSLLGVAAIPLLVALIMLYFVISHALQIKDYRKKLKVKKGNQQGAVLSIWEIPRGIFIKTIASCMGLMWSIGWILYTCALWSNIENDGNYAEILGYAAMASLDLFMLDINGDILTNVNDGPHIFPYPRFLKGCIVLVSILSALCTFIILINLFFSRFAAYLHSKLVKVSPKSNNHIYIFYGTGDKEEYLAKSIAHKDPRHMIVFIDNNDSRDSDDIDGWDKVIGHLTVKNPMATKMNQDKHGIFLISEGAISDFNSKEILDITPEGFWSHLGLKRIYTLLTDLNKNVPQKLSADEHDSGNQVHFFFLSDDRDRNISEANVISEIMAKKPVYENLKVSIYASARKDSVISVIEDKKTPDNQEIKIIDDSRLAVDILRRDEKSHPIRFVDIDLQVNPGTVKSPFNALLLGFGETGRDSLKYLYEFSAFLDSGSASKYKHRSKVRINVVDQAIDVLSGKFISDRPGINTPYNIESNGKESLIDFRCSNARSLEFHEYIKKEIAYLNYIVVSLGDDELNVTVATQLVKYARQYRPNLGRFKIFVRVYDTDSFSHLDDVITHYNRKLKDECGIDSLLESFGSVEQVYTYDLIVRDKFTDAGKNFGNSYWAYYEKVSNREAQMKKELGQKPAPTTPMSEWEKKDKKRFNSFEDLQNALHSLTKLHIIESFLRKECVENSTGTDTVKTKDEPKSDTRSEVQAQAQSKSESIWDNLFNSFDVTPEGIDSKRIPSEETVSYEDAKKISPKFDQLLTNLAITEHLRWNASHEMLGFIYGTEKNYRLLTHPCLLPWDKLDKISPTNALRIYDYLVVETTLLLKKKKEEKKRQEKEKLEKDKQTQNNKDGETSE